MITIQVNPASSLDASSCQTCCCTAVNIIPGATDKWSVMYGAWSRPIGGRGITVNTDFQITEKTATVPTGSNQPPVPALFLGITPSATTLNGTLTATDVESNTLTFAALPFYGPKHGVVTISPSGAFTYVLTPVSPAFTGYDRFFFTVTDAFNNPVVGEAIIGVSPVGGPPIAAPLAGDATPVVTVKPKNVVVNSPWQSITFPLEVSPQARVGSVYRMVLRQQAIDCDCSAYYRLDCFDLIVGKC